MTKREATAHIPDETGQCPHWCDACRREKEARDAAPAADDVEALTCRATGDVHKFTEGAPSFVPSYRIRVGPDGGVSGVEFFHPQSTSGPTAHIAKRLRRLFKACDAVAKFVSGAGRGTPNELLELASAQNDFYMPELLDPDVSVYQVRVCRKFTEEDHAKLREIEDWAIGADAADYTEPDERTLDDAIQHLEQPAPEPVPLPPAVLDLLLAAHDAMAFDSRDWSLDRTDAWLYALLVGWDEAEADIIAKHGSGWARACALGKTVLALRAAAPAAGEPDGLLPACSLCDDTGEGPDHEPCSCPAFARYGVGATRQAERLPCGTAAAVRESMATPHPLWSILTTLADAADHLLGPHDCDGHGHEGIKYAAEAARALVERIQAPPSEPDPTLAEVLEAVETWRSHCQCTCGPCAVLANAVPRPPTKAST